MAKIKSKLKSRKLLLFVGLGLLIALVLVGAWLVFDKLNKPSVGNDETDVVTELQIEAQEAAGGGDVEGGLRLYDEDIEASSDTAMKQNLLVAKAYFASGHSRNDEAIEAAKSADALGPTSVTVLALARLYEVAGNNQVAADQYQRLLDMIGSDIEGRDSSQDLRSEIERLRSL